MLDVSVEQGSFCGRASADHPLLANELAGFAEKLAAFPIAHAEVRFSREGTIDIVVEQSSPLGHIDLRVTVGSYFPKCSTMVTLRLDYEVLARFARDLDKLTRESVGQAVVDGNDA